MNKYRKLMSNRVHILYLARFLGFLHVFWMKHLQKSQHDKFFTLHGQIVDFAHFRQVQGLGKSSGNF